MTLPYERLRAVRHVEDFLLSLKRPGETPKVPRAIRERAAMLLRHYPTAYDMRVAAEKAPEIFGDGR